MDGTRRSRKTTFLARRAAATTAAAAALLCSAPALAADPAADFAPDSPPVAAAAELAKSYWQATPCAGEVSITWMALSPSTNATSTWTNPVGQYDAPEQNAECQIAFNSSLTWDWTRFCSVLVHEYGHLTGRPHSQDPADVMYPYYEKPVEQCVAAAPAQPAVVPEIVDPSAVLPPLKAGPRAVTSSKHVKRAIIVVVREPKHHTKHHHKPRHHQPAKHRGGWSKAKIRAWLKAHRAGRHAHRGSHHAVKF